jgi:hypothetical protein
VLSVRLLQLGLVEGSQLLDLCIQHLLDLTAIVHMVAHLVSQTSNMTLKLLDHLLFGLDLSLVILLIGLKFLYDILVLEICFLQLHFRLFLR